MEFILVKNSELTATQLNSIGKIKAQHWKHPIESQIQWMRATYHTDDTHILLMDNEEVVGYVAVAELSIIADKTTLSALGISCLCVEQAHLGKGYGLQVMDKALQFAKKEGKLLCLLCKEKLVGFYNKCGYASVESLSIMVENNHFTHELMVNSDSESRDAGVLQAAQRIQIDRNF